MTNGQTLAAIVVAAGTSSRMGFDKLFHRLDGVEVLLRAVMVLDTHPEVDSLVVVAGANIGQVRALLGRHPPAKPLAVVAGGATRAASVAAGVAACPAATHIAIHDAARPFVSHELIGRTLAAALQWGAAAPAVPVHDTIKRRRADGTVEATVPRAGLVAVQTPQIFRRDAYCQALAAVRPQQDDSITDDCMVMEKAGRQVALVPGEASNIKITTPADLPATPRVGHGYDVHRLVPGQPLVLGGVTIPHETGLLGHSDADVLLHAVADALLGAAALGDIGRHFPDSDPAYKGASSLHLLGVVAGLLAEKGYHTANVDATLVCQAPKLAPHIPAMCQNIANTLGVQPQAVNIKATTEEGLGFTGQQQGIAAHCVALLVGAG